MSNKVLLDDDMLDDVTGGNIKYINTPTERYLWGSHSPDQKYSFPSKSAVKNFVAEHYDELGERGCLAEMVKLGIIIPI